MNCSALARNIFSETIVVEEGYMESYCAIDGIHPGWYIPTASVTSDENNGICIPIKTDDMTFQAVFSFHVEMIRRQMSVEVLLKNVADCASPAWTWFVESGDKYLECSRKNFRGSKDRKDVTGSNEQISLCRVTCSCLPTCDYLYFKYYKNPFGEGDNSEICNVRLMYGHIEPTTQL